MRIDRTVVGVVVLWSGVAAGQGQPWHKGTGTYDLPIVPPSPPKVSTAVKPIEPPTGEDPRDTPPPMLYGEELDPELETITYVIDISGSMAWGWRNFITSRGRKRRGSRLRRAKVELIRSVRGLSANMKFNMIAYACGTRRWSDELKPATARNKAAARAWIRRLRARGGTGTGPAVSLALQDRKTTQVVLLTDGSPNCGARRLSGHRRMIRLNNVQAASISVFGISARARWRSFCQVVAADNGGAYYDVP